MAILMTERKGGQAFHVVHPLDDVAEEKCSPEGLGEMHMGRSTKLALYTLRGYLASMGLLVAYRLLTLSGALAHHVR